MAHNSRIRAGGLWVSGGSVDPAEFEAFDQAQFEAINGDDGGTWAPAAVITIGGSGLTVTGSFDASDLGTLVMPTGGSLALTGNSFITLATGTHLDVNSGGVLNVETGGAIEIESGGSMTVKAAASFTLAASSVGAFNGSVTMASGAQIQVQSGAQIQVNSGATLQGVSGCILGGTWTQTAKLIKSGSGGRTQWRETTLTPDASQSFSVSSDTIYYVHTIGTSVTLTANIASATIPTAGERITGHITNTGGGNVIVKGEGSVTMTLTFGAGAGDGRFVIEFDGTKWRALSWATSGALVVTLGGDK